MTKTKTTSNGRKAGDIGLLIPMYVFTILFVALPILYLFLLSFLQRAQVWGVDFTFTLDNYKRILEPLYLDTFWQSLKLAFERCLEAQDAATHHDPVLDQCADPPLRLDHCLPQQRCAG